MDMSDGLVLRSEEVVFCTMSKLSEPQVTSSRRQVSNDKIMFIFMSPKNFLCYCSTYHEVKALKAEH